MKSLFHLQEDDASCELAAFYLHNASVRVQAVIRLGWPLAVSAAFCFCQGGE